MFRALRQPNGLEGCDSMTCHYLLFPVFFSMPDLGIDLPGRENARSSGFLKKQLCSRSAQRRKPLWVMSRGIDKTTLRLCLDAVFVFAHAYFSLPLLALRFHFVFFLSTSIYFWRFVQYLGFCFLFCSSLPTAYPVPHQAERLQEASLHLSSRHAVSCLRMKSA
jgi:hypothetical protein